MTVKPLSNIDIEKKLASHEINIKFVPYHTLKFIKRIDDIIPCILLYELHWPIGHWVTIFRNSQGLQYFDPTGEVPDALLETNFEHPAGRVKMNADYTYLNGLLAQTGEPIIYNDKPLQTSKSNTCGYWCAVRLLFGDLTNDEFVNEWKKIKNGAERQRKIVRIYESI